MDLGHGEFIILREEKLCLSRPSEASRNSTQHAIAEQISVSFVPLFFRLDGTSQAEKSIEN
ncbi:MAG: hypothetical protein CEE38_14495 [Planctomycetes bacterium B3_Pla]|nr:MAG: hypothetical protein CEE38_14495 [Planctomycetes bacterium B3_Pla]